MDHKKEASRLFLKSKLYRGFAMVFACVGLLLFAYMYSANKGGDALGGLNNPLTIAFLVFSFLPAIVLSLIARRMESKANSYLTGK